MGLSPVQALNLPKARAMRFYQIFTESNKTPEEKDAKGNKKKNKLTYKDMQLKFDKSKIRKHKNRLRRNPHGKK